MTATQDAEAVDANRTERRTGRTCDTCTGFVNEHCVALPPAHVIAFVHREHGPQFETRFPYLGTGHPACRDLYQHDRRGVQP